MASRLVYPVRKQALLTKLKKNGVSQGSPVNGTGSAISFGNQLKGTYTVVATRVSTSCSATMSGSAVITQTGSVPPKPGAISSPVKNFCGGNFTFTIVAVQGALSYVWTPPAGGSVISNNGTSAVIGFPSNFTTGTVKVSAANNCGISAASSLAVKGITTPAGISGPTSVRSKQTNLVYSVINPQAGIVYQWVVPPNVTIVSGQNTPTITVNWRAASGVMKVAASNSCGTSTYASLTVNVVSSFGEAISSTGKTGVQQFNVTPNPTNGKAIFFFTEKTKDKYAVEVTDVYGKVLIKKEGISVEGTNEVELDLSNKPNAVYFVSLIDATSGRKTIKLIKGK